MTVVILLHIAAAGGYFAAWRRPVLLWAAAVLHCATLAAHYHEAPRFDLGMSASAFMLLTVAVGWRKTRPFTQTVLLLLACAAMFAPLAFAAARPPPSAAAWTHIAPAMLAYSFSLLAMLQWLDLWKAEQAQRRLTATSEPPLLTLEAGCFRTLAAAFVLLSAALISGFLIGGDTPAHKLLFAALSWLTFGALLLGRKLRGWRGRAAQWWLAVGLLFFLLSYFGTHFVLQVLLGRTS